MCCASRARLRRGFPPDDFHAQPLPSPPGRRDRPNRGNRGKIEDDVGDDPVKLGLVTSLARPGGNLTGINFFTAELAAKRLELIHELVPAATRVAVLVNPVSATGSQLRDLEAAAGRMGLQIQIINASTSREIDAAFALFAREPPHALFVGTGTFLRSRRVQLVASPLSGTHAHCRCASGPTPIGVPERRHAELAHGSSPAGPQATSPM
jgi:hypothetical protein